MTVSRGDAPDLVGLPEAAQVLGVHRATVNDMVLSRRLRARRRRGHWYIERELLEQFASTYQRPSNAPPPRPARELAASAGEILNLLRQWGDATVAELDEVLDLHEGNIRKQLRLLEARGLVERLGDGRWVPSQLDEVGPLASVG